MAFTLDRFKLSNKVAIVTGAGARGNSIGRAYAFGLANAGASVVVADLNGEGAERVAAEIREAGLKAVATQVDITDPASTKKMAEAAVSAFGGVDILVNNAALMIELSHAPPAIIEIDDWNRTFAVNVTGALNCSQACIPLMRARGGGRIVNALSAGAFPPTSVYGITKLALMGLTTALATHHGRENITVNAIAPGNTMSDAGRALSGPEQPFRKLLDQIVVMRVEGEPDDLVGPLLMLVSEAGAWMTGQVLHVDGGWIIRP